MMSTESLKSVINCEDEEEISIISPYATTPSPSNKIRAVNSSVTHRITSGQVVVTLATAVKEVVENSLDGGATNIEIMLLEYGSKLIEIKDNGTGIEESNFESIALKHHTSKIIEFDDLGSLSTFGFRGEALSSLAYLSTLTLTTRHVSSPQAHALTFDPSGKLIGKKITGRGIGTTVGIRNIFSTLPVRQRELLRNIKREFNRMVGVLYGYALVSQGVKMSCSNKLSSGSGSTIFNIPAQGSIKERIANLFGTKQIGTLVEIESGCEDDESIFEEYGVSREEFLSNKFKIEGFISRPNSGRSSADRQFYFINSRPCDSSKISKIVSEVYHSFSRNLHPFIYLNISTEQENLDVNVTPDKRHIYLRNEKILYATIKSIIHNTLLNASSSALTLSQSKLLNNSRQITQLSPCYSNGEIKTSSSDSNDISSPSTSPVSQISNSNEIYSPTSSSSSTSSTNPIRTGLERFNINSQQNSINNDRLKRASGGRNVFKKSGKYGGKQPKLMDFINQKKRSIYDEKMNDDDSDCVEIENSPHSSHSEYNSNLQKYAIVHHEHNNEEFISLKTSYFSDSKNIKEIETSDEEQKNSQFNKIYYSDFENKERLSDNVSDEDEFEILEDDENIDYDESPILSTSIHLNWDEIFENYKKMNENNKKREGENSGLKFRARISPDDNKEAEKELQRELTKENFKKMSVVGQFNMEFIVCKFESSLFIIDQHASDEKYNYEDLEKTTLLSGQRLILPMSLQLPAVSENIIMDNIGVFERNGFYFDIKPNKRPTERVSLTKIPFSKNITFGKSDVEELIFLLEDAPEKSYFRPLKVRSMFASRACRKSVMFGTKLTHSQMTTIVQHMAQIEQPWNCPHGRPTIRHLFNYDQMPDVHLYSFNHHSSHY